jgi:hypothetical protein
MSARSTGGVALLSLLWASAICGCASPAAPCPGRVLIDSIHAHNALKPATSEAQAYDYHHVNAIRRALLYLKARGVGLDEVTTGRLEPALLAKYRMLFVNLVSGDLPPFMVAEINAIRDYVHGGGSLLLITDHTNCYYHAWKLAPLLEELGIEVTLEMACEGDADQLGRGGGNGWIAVRRFARHPVTDSLRWIAFQSGGTVDGRHAIATTSSEAWGDLWQVRPYGDGVEPGYYGNFQKDPGERTGPLGVVLARQLGRGRIVVVADQNVFGDPFLHYADNWRLWLNAVGWLMDEPRLADAQAYEACFSPRIVFYEAFGPDAHWGDPREDGCFNTFAQVTRRLGAFARDDLAGRHDVIVFADDSHNLPATQAAALVSHLRAGRGAVFLQADELALEHRQGLIGGLVSALGDPRQTREKDCLYLSWPAGGQVAILRQMAAYTNRQISPPTTLPKPSATLHLARLLEVIGRVMHSP